MTVLFSPPNITSAVILCGPGTRLGPLVDGVPKALLPVAGVPAVQRVLDWLLAGTEVEKTVLVCRPSALEPLQSLLKSYKPPSKTVLEIVKEDADDEDENDTLSALSAALPKLPSHGHVAVLPCDIATDLPFSKVVDGLLEYSAKEGSPAVSVLAYEASKVEKSGAAVERGHDKDPEPDMLAYTSKGSLALFRPHDPDRSTFVVSPVLLSQTQNLTVSTEFRDAHVYLFANWAVRWLAERGKKEGWTNVRKGVAELVKAGWKPADWLKARGLDKHEPILAASLLLPANDTHFIVRANRAWGLLESTRRILDSQPPVEQKRDSAMVRRSAVGAGCTLSPDSKVINSLLGRSVEVGAKSKLEGCIVMDGAKIGKNCNLAGCDVAPGAVVEDGTTAKGETFAKEEESDGE